LRFTYEPGLFGVQAMELLSDQCTVVWFAQLTTRSMTYVDPRRRFVARTFAPPGAVQYGSDSSRFAPNGVLVRSSR